MITLQRGLFDLDASLITHFTTEEIEAFLGHSLDTPEFHREWLVVITDRYEISYSTGMPAEGVALFLFNEDYETRHFELRGDASTGGSAENSHRRLRTSRSRVSKHTLA